MKCSLPHRRMFCFVFWNIEPIAMLVMHFDEVVLQLGVSGNRLGVKVSVQDVYLELILQEGKWGKQEWAEEEVKL